MSSFQKDKKAIKRVTEQSNNQTHTDTQVMNNRKTLKISNDWRPQVINFRTTSKVINCKLFTTNDGKYIIGFNQSHLYFWDANTEKAIVNELPNQIMMLEYSSNGHLILSRDKEIQIYKKREDKVACVFRFNFRSQYTIYHKYIQYSLCSSKYGFIQYQRYQKVNSYVKFFLSGKLIRKYKNQILNVIACINLDSKYIAVNDIENTVNIINNTTGQIIKILRGHDPEEFITQMLITTQESTNSYLVSIDHTNILVWNLINDKCIKSKSAGIVLNCVRLSPDGKFIVTYEDSCIKTRSLKTLETISRIPKQSFEAFRSVQFSRDGNFIFYHDFHYIYIEKYPCIDI